MALQPPTSLLADRVLSIQQASLVDGLYVAVGVAILAIALAFRVMFARATYNDWGSTAHESRVNCPGCGARTTTDPPACDYCEEPLPDRLVATSG